MQGIPSKNSLTQENARVLEDIRSCCSISLHIRRTDYLSNPYLSPPPLEYYLRSMAEMEGRLRAAGVPQESLRYFVFSDDIEWARQNLSPALPHVHVDINDGGAGYFDLELMRNCRHHIIANSTFSWWAAWLNEHAEKIVIAPRIWFNRNEDDRYHTDDALIPGSWLRI
ncbi:alpha-1,2-fucosyltransferase [Akkermansia muciniphila]|nr:alpha-1,2-fucosyltransferase [Akkermansia muciniphila]